MNELVFSAPDYATLLSEAETLGFTTTDENGEKHIVTNGTFASGGGWFLNLVGQVYEPVTPPANPDDPWPEPVARPGYWGRLRLNGEPETMPSFSSAITQYAYVAGENDAPGGWVNLADGKPAPVWVSDIGVIA